MLVFTNTGRTAQSLRSRAANGYEQRDLVNKANVHWRVLFQAGGP